MKCLPISILDFKKLTHGKYVIYVAESRCEKTQGLREVLNLPNYILVLFKNIPPQGYFNTQKCYIPIDIIALDENGIILEQWTAQPGQVKIGPMPSRTVQVLEAVGGWAFNHGLKRGDKIFLWKSTPI